MSEQLTFDLPQRTAQGRDDFFVSPANALAVAQMDDWQNWPQRKLVLVGPEGAGKTHLTHVWADICGARVINGADILTTDVASLAGGGAVAVENADRIFGPKSEATLFHLHNLVLAEGGTLLLTARMSPRQWPLALPDLKSRMEATATATLEAPDDALLSALLVKLFTDRQLQVNPTLIPYLVGRMERSFGDAQRLVAALDAAALRENRAVTRGLAAQVLDNLNPDG